MIVQDAEPGTSNELSASARSGGGLPPGASVTQVAFVTGQTPGQQVLLEFPHPLHCRAVRVDAAGDAVPAVPTLSILSIPTSDHQDEALLRAARAWAGGTDLAQPAAHTASQHALQLMTLQGAQIVWCRDRVAVLAHADRIDGVTSAMIEASYYHAEMAQIERALGDAWPQLEADTPLAFEFNDRSIGRRTQLLQRFQEVLGLRARLARLAPLVHAPHVHPATLSSQIGERFRERTRLPHRHESLGEQLEVFEKVYESCGQRASDFMLSRSSNTLEWVIIVLLITQLLLHGFDLLTGLGHATGL